MKKQILYMCELCGTQFCDEKEANVCEKSHVRPLQIWETHFHRSQLMNYPDWINVKMCDGKVVRYKR